MKTEVRDDAKTQKVLASARQLFMLNGFEKTTMEEIARAIPMSKATLYAVFPNKEEILLAIIDAHCENLYRMVKEVADETTGDYLVALKRMIKRLVNSVYDESSTVRTPETLMYVSDRVKARSYERFARMKSVITGLLNSAVQAGELASTVETAKLCEVIMTMLTSYFPPYQRHFTEPRQERPDRATFDAEVETLLEVLINGLRDYKGASQG